MSRSQATSVCSKTRQADGCCTVCRPPRTQAGAVCAGGPGSACGGCTALHPFTPHPQPHQQPHPQRHPQPPHLCGLLVKAMRQLTQSMKVVVSVSAGDNTAAATQQQGQARGAVCQHHRGMQQCAADVLCTCCHAPTLSRPLWCHKVPKTAQAGCCLGADAFRASRDSRQVCVMCVPSKAPPHPALP